jgi:hypothetical protein
MIALDVNGRPPGAIVHATREAWLQHVRERMDVVLADSGHSIPQAVRLSCGFPRGSKGRSAAGAVGQAWSTVCSTDGTGETFVSPIIDDARLAIGITAHELIHHSAGIPAGHGPEFKVRANAIGFRGALTDTSSLQTPEWYAVAAVIEREVGPYPHGAMHSLDGKPSGWVPRTKYPEAAPPVPEPTPKAKRNRHVKLTCAEPACGFTCRAARGPVEEWGEPDHCGMPMAFEG